MNRDSLLRQGTRPEIATRQPGPYDVTHYLQHHPWSFRKALCGKPNPELDLTPVNGAITCQVCLDLWAQGYRGPDDA